MNKESVIDKYFEWMYDKVRVDKYYKTISYRRLLLFLHETEFTYTIPMDGNRAEDGIDLRYRFGRENSYNDSMIATYLDNRPCSVLEMMVALALRCEEHIMDDPDIGNRTGKWFWEMIYSLGLRIMYDKYYDINDINEKVSIFLNREYGRNGAGGLFTVNNDKYDMRLIDIWYQMHYYLNDMLDE